MTMVAARALIACARLGATDHGELAMYTASDAFTIGHVCLFGGGDDGMVALDDALTETAADFEPPERGADAAHHMFAPQFD